MTRPDSNSSTGFTLIEVLVVIAIIAILAGTVMANVASSRIKARDARRLDDMHKIQPALEAYYNDCGQYPPALDLTAADGCPDPITLKDYMPAIPMDPLGAAYTYVMDPDNDTYTLTFTLETTSERFTSGEHTLQPDGIR